MGFTAAVVASQLGGALLTKALAPKPQAPPPPPGGVQPSAKPGPVKPQIDRPYMGTLLTGPQGLGALPDANKAAPKTLLGL